MWNKHAFVCPQMFSVSEVVEVTKMTVDNLAIVWAPNCVSNTDTEDLHAIMAAVSREQKFLRTCIKGLDTSSSCLL